MTKSQKICTLLVLFSLISCEESGTQPITSTQLTPTANTTDSFQAIEQLNARHADSPDDFNVLSALADLYFETSQFKEAVQIYDKALAVNPACADCMNDKGLALFYLGDSLSALASLDQAVTADPGYTHAWLSKGFVLISLGRLQEAIEPLNKVKELDTTGTLSWEADKFLAQIAASQTQ